MSSPIADLLLSAARLTTLLGVTVAQSVNWVLDFKTAPAGVPQDLWELGLRSLIQHLTEPGLHKAYILTLVDYRIDADSSRLLDYRPSEQEILVATLVGHGSGTGGRQNPRAQCRFVGNLLGSELSSVGGFVTEMNTRPSDVPDRSDGNTCARLSRFRAWIPQTTRLTVVASCFTGRIT